MTGRTPLIAGNWKMHKTRTEAEAYVAALLPRIAADGGADVAVCAPFTALAATVDASRGSPLIVMAQTMHEVSHGAFTGEIAAPMLTELEVGGVLLGHSERRQLFGETDAALALKVPAALAAGLLAVLCVGETEQERAAGETELKLRHQIAADLAGVELERLGDVVVAYEPIWAIGTGQTASAEQAQQAIAFLRGLVAERSASAAERIRILYGGSVNAGNAGELLALPDVDGALVGGASLDPRDFATIVAAAPR
jgi:triosephosphate isomerase (TIM)